jgi:hypothetical protein
VNKLCHQETKNFPLIWQMGKWVGKKKQLSNCTHIRDDRLHRGKT